ncbi:MAG TPA: PEGA domain-containing protein [Thermoanaerobaculia bacterium]|nr:PEGA domain-containing protein [Thermoanaerobaculia bacterium]
MTTNSGLGFRIRPLLLAVALAVAVTPAAFAQHGGGGGGSHGGGGGGGSHGGGGYHGGGGGYHGGGWHGGYHGGYYGGWYRPYYPYWGWGWGWGGGSGWGWGWGWPGWYGYGGYYGAPYGSVAVQPYYSLSPNDWAVVNTDVSPETTRVFLDGVFIGMTDDFDGPQYLYLKKGDYQLEFRLDGFETKTVDVKARGGAQIKISDKLKKIPGSKQYGSYDNPEPEGGVQRFWSKEKNTPVHPVDLQNGGVQGDAITLQDQEWRGGAPPGQGQDQPHSPPPVAEGDSGQGYAPPPPAAEAPPKGRSRIVFRVEPADAAVYLNDHFVGTGEELSTLSRGLQVPPGQHTITVSRPGMKTQEQTVVVGPGKSETVEISLKP